MSLSIRTRPPEPLAVRARVLKLATLAALALGSGLGTLVAWSRAGAPAPRPELPLQAAAAAPEPPLPAAPSTGQSAGGNASGAQAAPEQPGTATDRRVIFSIRRVEAIPPPNPFEPVALPQPVRPSLAAPAAPGPGGGAAAASAAAPTEPEAPAAGDISLTGVVQGDPPLAVVQFQGQTLFLKIGDTVADSWRLVEIRERSAVLQAGSRRVEIPIKGGSSE